MIPQALQEVKPPPRLPFAFRADPVALDGLRLDPTARAVFVLLLDNAKSRGWRSRLSNSTMGRILGRNPMTISRALGRLESAGLIRRELIAGGRIRTGILVTWPGVRREDLTEQASVRRESLTGSAQASEGVRRERRTDQSSIQSQDQTALILPLGVNPEEVPDPATAAAFLRSMIQAGRKNGCKISAPTHVVDTSPAEGVHKTDPLPVKAIHQTDTLAGTSSVGIRQIAPPAGPRLDDPNREVRVMLDALAGGFTAGVTARRRLSPQELQRQLAQVRRKQGGRR